MTSTPGAVPQPPPVDDPFDSSNAPRLLASEVPAITGVRLKPHSAGAVLVNISTSGMLTECTSRLKVGSTVAVLFEGTFPVESVVGRIVRCEVSAMGRDSVLRYHIAIAFTQPIAADALPVSSPPPATAAAPLNPLDARDPIAAIAARVAPAPVAARNRW
jgi:PilZ domain-containing protein